MEAEHDKSSTVRANRCSKSKLKRRATIILNYEYSKYDELLEICQNNRQYFESDASDMGQRFFDQFEQMIIRITAARLNVSEFYEFVHEYDFDDVTPGNGYRSLVKAMHAAIDHCTNICTYIAKNRGYYLFRRSVYIK